MRIGSTGNSSLQDAGLVDRMRALREEGKNATAEEAEVSAVSGLAAASAAPAASSNSNMMAGNFVSKAREESKYINATKMGLRSEANMVNRQNAILAAGISELEALSHKESGGGYAMRALIGRKTARKIMREGQQTTMEESERNLKEARKAIEQKAQEALAPKDENGEPIVTDPAGNAGEAAQPDISAPRADASQAEAPLPELPAFEPVAAEVSVDAAIAAYSGASAASSAPETPAVVV